MSSYYKIICLASEEDKYETCTRAEISRDLARWGSIGLSVYAPITKGLQGLHVAPADLLCGYNVYWLDRCQCLCLTSLMKCRLQNKCLLVCIICKCGWKSRPTMILALVLISINPFLKSQIKLTDTSKQFSKITWPTNVKFVTITLYRLWMCTKTGFWKMQSRSWSWPPKTLAYKGLQQFLSNDWMDYFAIT